MYSSFKFSENGVSIYEIPFNINTCNFEYNKKLKNILSKSI